MRAPVHSRSGSPVNSSVATRGCMGSLRFFRGGSIIRCGSVASSAVSLIFLFSFLMACGGSKPPGASPFPARITLNPAVSVSMTVGSTLAFTASAQNATNASLNPTFTYALEPSSAPGILDVSPAGFACAGSWNAPYYNVCTPAGTGVVEVIASGPRCNQPAHSGFRPPSRR